MTAPSLLGMEWTSWRHFARSIFFHSSRMTSFRDWMLDGEWCSTCLFRIPHRCSIGFRSGDILGPLNHFHPVLLQKSNSGLRCVFRIIVMLEKCTTTKGTEWWKHLLFQYRAVHLWKNDAINEMQLPDTSSTHAAPHKDTATTMFHCRQHAFFFVFLTFATPHSFEAISSKNIYLGLITPEYRVPVVFIFVSMGPGKL